MRSEEVQQEVDIKPHPPFLSIEMYTNLNKLVSSYLIQDLSI